MWKRILNFIWRFIKTLALVGLLVLSVPRMITAVYSWTRIYTVDTIPPGRVAIVFGAGLTQSGYPTAILRDRVETAAQLYFAGKVEKLLMSGDNSTLDYNEPESMRQYALSLGIPDEDIVLDYAGRRTYDTCYRAKAIFGLERAILVTQDFHLPRALYLCNALGIQAVGVQADGRDYRKSSVLYWNMRELIAAAAALWDVNISHPVPVLGEPEPIFPEANSQ